MKKFGFAVWTHGVGNYEDEAAAEAAAERWAGAGYDLVIPCVKGTAGQVDFRTDLADVNPSYGDWDPLKVLMEACRARGVKVYPWFCVFPEGEQSRLLREHREYAAVFGKTGSKHRWACACRPEVQDYVFALYEDLAARYRPDGLHLDYIRTGGICTCEFCKAEMAGQGVDIESIALRDPAYEQWVEWRVSRVTGFVQRLHEFTRRQGLELSAAVFAGYPDCRRSQGQDWVQWAERGLVEWLFPMNYTNSARWAVARATCHAALVAGRVPLWEGLGKGSSSSQLTTEALIEQVEGVLAAGAKGIVVFHEAAVTEADVQAIRRLRGG